MRFSLAAFSPFLAVANAIITGIAVPETIAPGESFTITLRTQNYIQAVYDVAFVVGYADGDGHSGSLGTVLGSYYLGPNESNILTNITRSVPFPAGNPMGDGLITVSIMSLFGVASGPSLTNFNVTVTVGDMTSKIYKSSS
ncbi:hypothetical protein V8C37DRAFT_385705 [Trichoderma ceciliae]